MSFEAAWPLNWQITLLSSEDFVYFLLRHEKILGHSFCVIILVWRMIFIFSFQDLMCQELGVNSDTVERIRKLPDTKLRRDVEVRRLEDYAKLELVLNSS